MLHHPPWWRDSLFPHSPFHDTSLQNEGYANKHRKVSQAEQHRSVVRLKVQLRGLLWQTKEREKVLTRWGAGLDLGGRRVSVCVLVAPGSVPSRQPQRLEAQAQVCDTRRCPGWCHLLGARRTTVGEEHPPAAHCSQLRLFSVRDPVQRNRNRTVKRTVKSVSHRNPDSQHITEEESISIILPSCLTLPCLTGS